MINEQCKQKNGRSMVISYRKRKNLGQDQECVSHPHTTDMLYMKSETRDVGEKTFFGGRLCVRTSFSLIHLGDENTTRTNHD